MCVVVTGYELTVSQLYNYFIFSVSRHTMTSTPSKSSCALAAPFKATPLCGNKMNDISFSGGAPILVRKLFITTATSTTGQSSFIAIRYSHDSNMMKVESGAKQAPSILFESAIDAHHGLVTYIGLVHCHFVEYGMDDLFYIVTLDGSWVNILHRNS
jgi:hypothetical protein